jgi:hypothetical protein
MPQLLHIDSSAELESSVSRRLTRYSRRPGVNKVQARSLSNAICTEISFRTYLMQSCTTPSDFESRGACLTLRLRRCKRS